MAFFGGLCPWPMRFGGGKPPLETHVKSLQQQLGTNFDTTDTTGLVYVRIQAFARVVWDLWEQNQRLANQWDPERMTDFLPRWEKILATPPSAGDSLSTRRARVAIAMGRAGYGDFSAVYSALTLLLGSCFVEIVTQSSGTANVWTPSSWPMGMHDATGVVDWYSTIAYVAVKVTQPSTMSDNEFYTRVASIYPMLDAIMPAWVTFDWYREDIHGAAGFFLDDDHNLDNEAFD